MKTGRPLKYNTAEEMQIHIDEYFEKCQPKPYLNDEGKPLLDGKGNPIIELNPPTITGLALHLGFVNRASMYDYEERGEFSNTVKKARTRCENWLEVNGLAGKTPPAMAIFALKNYGWTDRQDLNHTGNIDSTVQINITPVKANKD